MRDSATGVAYLYGDHLGSASVAVGANGAVLSRTRYKPWNELSYDYESRLTSAVCGSTSLHSVPPIGSALS